VTSPESGGNALLEMNKADCLPTNCIGSIYCIIIESGGNTLVEMNKADLPTNYMESTFD
jgi:hypothetical protein